MRSTMTRRGRLMRDLRAGLRRVRHVAVAATKVAARQTDLYRLKLQLDAVERRLARTHRALGEFAFERLLRHDPDLLVHPEVRRLLHEAAGFRAEQRRLLAEVEEAQESWAWELRHDEESSSS